MSPDPSSSQTTENLISAIKSGGGSYGPFTAQKICIALGIRRDQVPASLQWPDPISQINQLDRNIGRRLETSTIENSLADERRKAVGGKVTWDKLLTGAYMPREQHLEEAYKAFSEWENDVVPKCPVDKVPLFWIGGRSGDGKSALLLQLIHKMLLARNRINIFQLQSGATIPTFFTWFNNTLPIDERSRPTYLVIDDLHLLDNPKDIFEQVNYYQFSILACGPTPEFWNFIHRSKSMFQSKLHEISAHNEADRSELATWLGVNPPIESLAANQLLVETLFELAIDDTIQEFANKFKVRLQRRGFYEATKSALSLNLFDMLAPIGLAGDQTATLSLKHMSDENHLHFEKGEQFGIEGFRLIHGKIAWRLFQHWVTAEYEDADTLHSLAESVALALSHTGEDNHLCINMLINTAKTRVKTFFPELMEEDEPVAVLRFILFLEQSTRQMATANAQMVRAALQYTPQSAAETAKILAQAIKARDNIEVTHRARMSVAAALARSHHFTSSDGEEVQFSALLEMLKDEDFWSVAIAGIMALLTRNRYHDEAIKLGLKWVADYPFALGSSQILARLIKEGVNNLVIATAYKWIGTVGQVPRTSSVLGALIAQDKQDQKVKTLALSFIQDQKPEPWHQQIICTLLRKHARDEELTALTKKWLDECNWQKGSESVVSTLISKGKNKDENNAFVLGWIKGAGSRTGLESVFRALIKASKGQRAAVDAALTWVQSSNDALNKAGVIGTLLAHSGDRPDVIQVTQKWLDGFGLRHCAMEVLKAYIPASSGSDDAILRSLLWITTNLNQHNSEQVIRALLANTRGRQDVIDMNQKWLEIHQSES